MSHRPETRVLAAGAVFAAALSLHAGCGGGPSTASAPAPAPAPAPTPAPPPVPPPSAPPSGLDVVQFLLDEVSEIAAPGIPGRLCVYGPDAFSVVVGAFHDAPSVSAPVVAAGRWESGRVAVFGHDGYFRRATLETGGTGRLMTNAFYWVAGESGQANPRIGTAGAPELRNWLVRNGLAAVETTLTPQSLATVDVVAVVMWNQGEREIEALRAFVRGGGGLVASATPWAWDYLNPYQNLVGGYAGNRLLEPVGIQWAYGVLVPTSRSGFSATGPPPGVTHAREALDVVAANLEGDFDLLSDPELGQSFATVILTAACMPPDDTSLAASLDTLADRVGRQGRWPTAARPVGRVDCAEQRGAAVYVLGQRHTPAAEVRAHPAAADFPGSVPAGAPRVSRTVAVDTGTPRWHSTGLYAAPGEVVTVTMPASAAAVGGFQVRVGAHTDGIWLRSDWTRMPEITRSFPVSAATTPVANAFGGLIYIEVPERAGLGRIDVRIDGAVAAPLFVLGETDLAVWRNEIRHAPAPWAEIAGRNMIVTTDSREVRRLDDPTAVANAWDRVVDLTRELAAWDPRTPSIPQRFVVDRQISNGYMHAGYPLMAHLDQQANLVDAGHLLREGNWGFFHEVGHNHQNYDWTFEGTVEVTVNLFTLFVYERLLGVRANGHFRGSSRSHAELLARYDFNNPDFDQWKREPFLALIMYAQMQEAFGWDAYRRVFATYLALPDAERPRTDDEKRDQWLVRFSRTVGRNLGPFYEAWGVPTSQAARDSIASLPEWMPPDFPPGR